MSPIFLSPSLKVFLFFPLVIKVWAVCLNKSKLQKGLLEPWSLLFLPGSSQYLGPSKIALTNYG
jgi:hypothetical protein